ncbi:MAG: type VI secretion system protein TssA [Tepidisphaeraceae bacterium]|jgi:type VI secretion system protein ImpA
MGAIDVESLLREISPQSPAGDDLQYDPAYMEFVGSAQVAPEKQYGQTIVPAREPNWRDVRSGCVKFLGRTKELGLVIKLVEANLRLEGFDGLREGLALLRGMLERYWDGLYPALDPADGSDPIARLNLLAGLEDPDAILRPLRAIPLASSPVLGQFGLREIAWATRQSPVPQGVDPPKPETIEAAFKETPPDTLKLRLSVLQECAQHAVAISQTLTGYVGAEGAPDFGELLAILKDGAAQIEKRVVPAPGAISAAGGSDTPMTTGSQNALTGEIRSRSDIATALDKICDYFAQFEPSSPVPLLLRRAQRLISKDFVSIIKDLSPEAIQKIELIGGTTPKQD